MGRLRNLTQTNILDTTIVLASKYGNHEVKKCLAEPYNHGPSHNIYSPFDDANFTMKKTLKKRGISQFIFQVVKIQWKSSIGFG